MATKITVTKTDNNNFNVNFSDTINGPGDLTAGSKVPVEWMQSVLDYYQRNAHPVEGLSDSQRRMLPW